MTREIVVGSTWAHGNGEVTVTGIPNGWVTYERNRLTHSIDAECFRDVFRHVRDPEPEVKVGTWLIGRGSPENPARIVSVNGGYYCTIQVLRLQTITMKDLMDYWKPCEPPPDVKAAEELFEAATAVKNVMDNARYHYKEYSRLVDALRAVEEASK